MAHRCGGRAETAGDGRRGGLGPGPPPRSAALAVLAALASLLFLPAEAAGQLRRDPPVQPLGEERPGALLLGVGVGLAADGSFPLAGLRGDLFLPARLSVAWAPAPGVILEVRGDAWRILSIEERGPSHVPLDPAVDDGTTADAGDFRIGILARVLGAAEGLSAGLGLEVTLPNSDEEAGIGTNTTDVRLGVLGGYGGGAWRATGEVGVAILEAPLEPFVQNDVLAYAGELLHELAEGARLSLGFRGRASTRGRVPLGTEDRGEVGAGLEVGAGGWRVDGGVSAGYAGTSPAWTLMVGVARTLGR